MKETVREDLFTAVKSFFLWPLPRTPLAAQALGNHKIGENVHIAFIPSASLDLLDIPQRQLTQKARGLCRNY